jgi:hypothetical protein
VFRSRHAFTAPVNSSRVVSGFKIAASRYLSIEFMDILYFSAGELSVKIDSHHPPLAALPSPR